MEAWQIKKDAARTAEVHSKVDGVLEYAAPYAQDPRVSVPMKQVKALRNRFRVYYPNTYRQIMALITDIHQAVAPHAEKAQAVAAEIEGSLAFAGELVGTPGFKRITDQLQRPDIKFDADRAASLVAQLDDKVNDHLDKMEDKHLAELRREAWENVPAGNTPTGPDTAARTAACNAVGIHLFTVKGMDLRTVEGLHDAGAVRATTISTLGKAEGTQDEAIALAAGHLCPICKGPVAPGKSYWRHADRDGPACEHRIDYYPVPGGPKKDHEAAIAAHREKIRAGLVTEKPSLPDAPDVEAPIGGKDGPYTYAAEKALGELVRGFDARESNHVRHPETGRGAYANAVIDVPALGEVRVLMLNPHQDLLAGVLKREPILASGDGALLSIPMNKGMTTGDLAQGKQRVKFAVWRNYTLGSDYTLAISVDIGSQQRRDDVDQRGFALHPVIIHAHEDGTHHTAVLSRDQYVGVLSYARVEEQLTLIKGDLHQDEGGFMLQPGRYVLLERVESMGLHWRSNERDLQAAMDSIEPLAIIDRQPNSLS